MSAHVKLPGLARKIQADYREKQKRGTEREERTRPEKKKLGF